MWASDSGGLECSLPQTVTTESTTWVPRAKLSLDAEGLAGGWMPLELKVRSPYCKTRQKGQPHKLPGPRRGSPFSEEKQVCGL